MRLRFCLPWLLFFITQEAYPEDWPLFRRDSLHTGFASQTTDTLIQNLAWIFPTQGPIYASPVVQGHTVYFASTDNYIYAIEDTTGRLKWKRALGNWIESTPAVTVEDSAFGGKSRVFVASMDHKVYALDALTGQLDWTYETSSWIESSPLVVGQTLFIGGTDHVLYCLDAVTGAEKWKFRVHGDIFSSPAYYQGRIYFGADDDTLYAVDYEGHLCWKYGTGGYSIYASPSIADGMVIVGTVDNGIKYFEETEEIRSLNNKILALDALTGELKWEYRTEPNGLLHASPAVAYGKVYYATDQGRVRALNLKDGSLVWETGMPDTSLVWASPAVAAGAVYVATCKGRVLAFDAEDGRLSGNFSLPGEGIYLHSSPVIANNFLYLGGSDGNLYAIGRPSPTEVESERISTPTNFFLSQNYPNPFFAGNGNQTTSFHYTLPRASRVRLRIYNLLGQEVRTLVDKVQSPGHFQVHWDGRDNRGLQVVTGIYFYRLEAENFVKTRKMIVISR
ncbi:MAG: PQQ-binding-like beta-propeller repeat protein [candidate division KSB1 bacterium]|nr:PQQ-binding-like beta-propeller repeat protein [candidate division KSB1 bacterium]